MDFSPTLLHDIETFLLLAQDGCSRPSVYFSILSNRYVTWNGIREKMEDWGEKMKTHVSKISPGSRAWFYPMGEVNSHKDFQRYTNQNIKMGFSHEFSWSISFRIYLQFWNRMSKNQDNMICRFWSTTKLKVEVSQPVEPKNQNGFFLMCSLLELES